MTESVAKPSSAASAAAKPVAKPAAATRAASAPGPSASASRPATSPVAQAADDDELLEFLGTLDEDGDENGDWLEFLARTDFDRFVRRGKEQGK